jgi:hypothetical protein
MYLASDYIYPYKDIGGRPSHCRVRIYLADDILDAPVVICSELPNNPGGSITNSAESIAAGVFRKGSSITAFSSALLCSMRAILYEFFPDGCLT